MKITLIFILLLLTSCIRKVEPIEKYYGHNYEIIKIRSNTSLNMIVSLKNKDTIISNRTFLTYDIEKHDLKVGDTLK